MAWNGVLPFWLGLATAAAWGGSFIVCMFRATRQQDAEALVAEAVPVRVGATA